MRSSRSSELRAQKKEQYEHLCAQIAREDALYQQRINFMIVLNIGLAAGALSQFHYGWHMGFCALIAVFALVLLFSLGSQIYEGKKQIHALKGQYYARQLHSFPRPFHLDGGDPYDSNRRIRPIGRVVREFAVGWSLALIVSLTLFFYFAITQGKLTWLTTHST
jgi:hypothetical protein